MGIWFYESHWTHENTRYVDAQVRKLEELGANALPVFCNPVTDSEEQEDSEASDDASGSRARPGDAEWTVENYFIAGDAGGGVRVTNRSSTPCSPRSCSRCR